MTKADTYFRGLEEIGKKYFEEKKELKRRKEEIVEKYGYGSDQYREWYKENEALEFPLSQGTSKACNAWLVTREYKETEFEMNNFLWDGEVKDFVKALREAGIESFIYTNQSTAVMENLHSFAAAGCTIDGLDKAVRTENRFGRIEQVEHLGIRIKVN